MPSPGIRVTGKRVGTSVSLTRASSRSVRRSMSVPCHRSVGHRRAAGRRRAVCMGRSSRPARSSRVPRPCAERASGAARIARSPLGRRRRALTVSGRSRAPACCVHAARQGRRPTLRHRPRPRPTLGRRPGGRHHEPRPSGLHRAREPVVRSLLRHVPRAPTASRWTRTDGRRSALPDPVAARCVPPSVPRHELHRSGRPARRGLGGSRSTAARWTASSRRAAGRQRLRRAPDEQPCPQAVDGPQGQPDVMGYHTARRSRTTGRTPHVHPARPHVRPDRLLDPARAPVPDLGVVGDVLDLDDPMSCTSDQTIPGELCRRAVEDWAPKMGEPRPYAWATSRGCSTGRRQLGLLRRRGHVRGAAVRARCEGSGPRPCRTRCPGSPRRAATGQLDNIRPTRDFFASARNGDLPSVSWIVPGHGQGRAPAPSRSRQGQAYVTKADQRRDAGPREQCCARRSSSRGTTGAASTTTSSRRSSTRPATGSACPAMVISPWAKPRLHRLARR